MTDLLPCPFCETPAEDYGSDEFKAEQIGCPNMHCSLEGVFDLDEWQKFPRRVDIQSVYAQFESSLRAERERAEQAEQTIRAIDILVTFPGNSDTEKVKSIRTALGINTATKNGILDQIDKVLNIGDSLSKIERIKAYRQLTDSSLVDSKIFIEAHYADNGYGKRI